VRFCRPSLRACKRVYESRHRFDGHQSWGIGSYSICRNDMTFTVRKSQFSIPQLFALFLSRFFRLM